MELPYFYNIICYGVNIFSTILLFPKIYKVHKEETGKSISLLYVFFRIITSSLLIIYAYGLLTYVSFDVGLPLFISQISILISSFTLIFFKFKYKKKDSYEKINDLP